ncbi:unnamed protein product [Dovyalis caffra]|uniref:Uncharacterized protein n=1 Tax=Dovyalis caffra TaxID=77055 RepID=A0AAV1RYT5_9ROSI|nr:unnamed protein product [Dovyalis caffra]
MKMKVCCFLLLLMILAVILLYHQPSIAYKAMALVSDRSLEMGTVKIASNKHFSTEVKVEKGRRLRRSIPSPPPPKPNRLRSWLFPPKHGASPPPPLPIPPLLPPPPPPLSPTGA